METANTARRTEDIALDLLKFIASNTNVVKAPGGGTPGFAGSAIARPDDQVGQLLDLYTRCRKAVESTQ